MLPRPPDYYVDKMRALHVAMRDRLLHHLHLQEEDMLAEDLAGIADVRGGDTIYTIDAHVEEILFDFCEAWGRADGPFVLISEGIEDAGWRTFPEGATIESATFLMIVDPIDGTRNIMYNKRSAWILSGIAPNNGPQTNLADIDAAVMTEAPTTRALFGDQLWATRGGGAHRESTNLVTGEKRAMPLRPSQADSLAHGFAAVSKFFPPAKAATAAFEEKLLERVAPNAGENPLVFDDEYICTGGQIYEILVGHDRFIADLRPIFFEALGLPKKLVCHPYDICTALIADEAGISVTNADGTPLSALLDIRADVAWVGYANTRLRDRIQPHLIELLKEVQGN